MVKKIYSFLIMLTFFVACKDDQVGIITYTRKIDMLSSSISASNLDAAYLYSIDGGTTWVAFPSLKNGQKYQAKVVYNPDPGDFTFPDEGSIEVVSVGCYTIDWSTSDPAPVSVDAATGIATFAVGGKNQVIAKVTDTAPFSVDQLAGTYAVVNDDWVDFQVGSHLTVTKIDATHFKIEEYPATDVNHAPLVMTVAGGNASTGSALTTKLTIASQNTGYYSAYGPGTDVTCKGTGTASSCAGNIDLVIDFNVKTYGDQGNFGLSLKKI
ncbi:MAG TPA: hypothetical protein VL728_18385 [Cyclobacteriaceae bacterium]|nr:hypothetical protein [Cyclobacteriaceae bacterium]